MLGLHTKKTLFIFDRSTRLDCGAGRSLSNSDRPPSLSRQNKSKHSWATNCPYSPAFFKKHRRETLMRRAQQHHRRP